MGDLVVYLHARILCVNVDLHERFCVDVKPGCQQQRTGSKEESSFGAVPGFLSRKGYLIVQHLARPMQLYWRRVCAPWYWTHREGKVGK